MAICLMLGDANFASVIGLDRGSARLVRENRKNLGDFRGNQACDSRPREGTSRSLISEEYSSRAAARSANRSSSSHRPATDRGETWRSRSGKRSDSEDGLSMYHLRRMSRNEFLRHHERVARPDKAIHEAGDGPDTSAVSESGVLCVGMIPSMAPKTMNPSADQTNINGIRAT